MPFSLESVLTVLDFGSDTQIKAKAALAKAYASANMCPAGPNANAQAGRRLNRFAIGTTGRQGKTGQDQQNDPKHTHHTNAFHRLI
jgi:hypothetical protein